MNLGFVYNQYTFSKYIDVKKIFNGKISMEVKIKKQRLNAVFGGDKCLKKSLRDKYEFV